jgi:exopolysaccharide biosynthesis polyprenyl glycosylphosphotransferase
VPAPRAAAHDPFSGSSWTLLSLASDAAMLWAALAAATRLAPRGPIAPSATWLLVALAVATIARLGMRQMYGERPSRLQALDTIRESVTACAVGTLSALALAALVDPDPATTSGLLAAGALGTAGVTTLRLALLAAQHRARARGLSGKRTLIVGAGWVGAQLEKRLLERPGLGLHPIGFLDADPAPAFRDLGASGPVLGGPADLGDIAARTGVEHVIVAFSSAPDSTVLPVIRQVQQLGLEVSVVPRLFENVNDRQWVAHVGGMALCGLPATHPRSLPFTVKHLIERVIATVGVVVLSPVLLLLALGVRASSPGPVLFRQRRVGRDGQVFDILKFRTMREPAHAPGAGGVAAELAGAGHAPGGVEGDDRRTTIGTFLRRSSLDELPQLFNVVLGHMSLVGPRPERPEFVALFGTQVRGYDDRHRVKSGMTGWAQVNGLRGQTSLSDRIELDNWYVQNWSPWLDLKIVLLTPLEVLRSRAEALTGAAETGQAGAHQTEGAAALEPDAAPAGTARATAAADPASASALV